MSQIDITNIPGVVLLPAKVSNDSRGTFVKFFERDIYTLSGFDPNFDAMAISTNLEVGTLRGLHFQSAPYEEEKMITCLQGSIFEVIVDLRRNSTAYGKWAAIEVGEESFLTLCLPKGIAHGYQTLSPGVRILYGLSSEFNQEHSHTLHYADTNLGINWPLPIGQISTKDMGGLSLQAATELANDNSR
jgi:dTDP-4-dehydrorhamnose 3,5-epimerase